MLIYQQGIYDIIIASDEKSEVFGDDAADGEGEKKEPKKSRKEADDGAEQPKKKRKSKKDEEYGVSRGRRSSCSLTKRPLTGFRNRLQERGGRGQLRHAHIRFVIYPQDRTHCQSGTRWYCPILRHSQRPVRQAQANVNQEYREGRKGAGQGHEAATQAE
jgi:hypothetical protein